MDQGNDVKRALAILQRAGEVGAAQVLAAQAGNGNRVRVLTLDLGTAVDPTQPRVIGEPFASMTVVTASDSAANFNMRVDTIDSDNQSFNVKAPATIEAPPLVFLKAFLDWTAQPGKTITIAFLKFGSFRTNQTNLSLSGGVNINDGSSSLLSTIALTGGSATLIAAASTARKKIEFRNTTGSAIYLGPDNTVTASSGRIVDVGDDYSWYNYGPLYAFSAAGANLVILTHS